MAVEERRARRVAVLSGKGGVGKTVITANLAAGLAAGGERVLVVDADLGLANLDVLLGVIPKITIQDVLAGSHTLEEAILRTGEGFDLLPAGSGFTGGTSFTVGLAESMDGILGQVAERYDTILFDAGAGIGDVVLFFANLSDAILLVVTPEPTSLMDSYATVKVLKQLYGRSDFLLIVNQADPNCPDQVGASVATHLQTVVSRFLGTGAEDRVRLDLVGSIPVDPQIPRSISRRQLLRESSPQAPAASVLRRLADSVRSRICA